MRHSPALMATRIFRRSWLAALALAATLLSGCDPSINFYGSFFPAWIWGLTLALISTILLRFVFAALRLERNLGPLVVVYPCLLLLLSCVAWLVLFRD